MAPAEPRIVGSLADIDPADWDALHDGGNPLVSHAFLSGLEQHGCLRPQWGWTPHHLTLWRGGSVVAAAPGYVKKNSHGELVFDHAWAHAYARHGRDYFPKWLCAVPYSPVTGPRLLAPATGDRRALVDAMSGLAAEAALSSAHVNFHDAGEDEFFDGHADAAAGPWLQRLDVQYHWHNTQRWRDFDDFLAAMDHKHRKKIRQERARVIQAGVRFRVVHGGDASPADLTAMHAFYLRTFAAYGNAPALTVGFFRHLAARLPRQLVLLLAELDGETIAGALCLRGGDCLFGRYWGASREMPGLHFETCYYQGIEYCLREGLSRFEPGAQGEHKIARGFLPVLVRSHHQVADPAFCAALQPWCAEERRVVRRQARLLAERTPFRRHQDSGA
jgi:uncharacterized protein